MKIVNTANGVQTNASTSNFNIEMNGKAFKALFSDIYTEKIAAVVREVGSNCADAHKMAGKESLPFKIKIHIFILLNIMILKLMKMVTLFVIKL